MFAQLGTIVRFALPRLTHPLRIADMGRHVAAAAMIMAAAVASAQELDMPVVIPPSDGQAADCATSTVSGLDPAGDNFLAIHAGPGTTHRKIDELHSGNVVFTCDARGDWIGIRYPDRNGRSGWVHGRYLTPLAGWARESRHKEARVAAGARARSRFRAFSALRRHYIGLLDSHQRRERAESGLTAVRQSGRSILAKADT